MNSVIKEKASEVLWAVEQIEGVKQDKGGHEWVKVKWRGYREREWVFASQFSAEDLQELKSEMRARGRAHQGRRETRPRRRQDERRVVV